MKAVLALFRLALAGLGFLLRLVVPMVLSVVSMIVGAFGPFVGPFVVLFLAIAGVSSLLPGGAETGDTVLALALLVVVLSLARGRR